MNKKLTPLLTLEREFLNTWTLENLPPRKIAIHMVTEKCKVVATPERVVFVVLIVVRFIRELTWKKDEVTKLLGHKVSFQACYLNQIWI